MKFVFFIIIYNCFFNQELFGQKISKGLDVELAHVLFVTKDFASAAKIYNNNKESCKEWPHETFKAALANFMINDKVNYFFWLKKQIDFFPKINRDEDFGLIPHEFKSIIRKDIDSMYLKSDFFINLNIELFEEISNLNYLDQFIRIHTNYIGDYENLDSVFIFNELKLLLSKDITFENIGAARLDIDVMLTHQAHYSNFNHFVDEGIIDKLIEMNVLTQLNYAFMKEIYADIHSGQSKYGLFYLYGRDTLPSDVININYERNKIGLLDLDLDYRNLRTKKPVNTSKLERIKKLYFLKSDD